MSARVIHPGTCTKCLTPMRPPGTTLQQHPGTRMRRNATTCTACQRRQDRQDRAARKTALAARREKNDAQAKEAFEEAQRARLQEQRARVTIYGLDDPDPRIREVARSALTYHEDRRARGIPATGLPTPPPWHP